MSFRFSGDTDAFSSDPSECAGRGSMAGSAIGVFPSSNSVSTWETIAGLGPTLFLRGFEIGELLMLVFGLALTAFFRAFFDRSTFAVV